MRSYSRNSGLTSCDETTMPEYAARNAPATARSWRTSRSACKRHTATASTAAGMSGSRPSKTSISVPRASRRPDTSNRRSRGTSGAGRSTNASYNAGRVWRAISISSAKPRVATSATRAPRRSKSALVATVVPCARTPTRPRASTASIARSTARAGSSGVDATLATRPSCVTTSVNVPPLSIPSRTRRRYLHRRRPERERVATTARPRGTA